MTISSIPRDLDLEREVVGAILARYATNTQLRPEHCYDWRYATILRAWHACGKPAPTVGAARDGDTYVIIHVYEPLARQLTALGVHDIARLCLIAGIIAAQAPVTGRSDVARLRLYAYQRRRLARLEHERLTLLGIAS